MEFDDKAVIVTGGASGIGFATALKFGLAGARVVIADYDQAKAAQAVEKLQGSGVREVMSVGCNVAEEAEVIRSVDAVLARHGRLDVIVNNAGTMIFKPIEEHTEADLLNVLRIDFFGAFWFTKQAFLKCRPGSSIVNVSSIHAVETTPLVAAYAAAKAALLSLTRTTAMEGKPKGIRANAVLPGAIATPMLWDNPNVKSGTETIDPAYVGQPEDVASAIVYLASSGAGFVTGAALRVDGGRLARL